MGGKFAPFYFCQKNVCIRPVLKDMFSVYRTLGGTEPQGHPALTPGPGASGIPLVRDKEPSAPWSPRPSRGRTGKLLTCSRSSLNGSDGRWERALGWSCRPRPCWQEGRAGSRVGANSTQTGLSWGWCQRPDASQAAEKPGCWPAQRCGGGEWGGTGRSWGVG